MGVSLFILIAVLVNAGATTAFDNGLLRLFRNGSEPVGPEWLTVHFRDITTLGSNWWIIFIGIVSCLILRNDQHTAMAGFLLLTIGSGMLMSFALKVGFHRPRPDLVAHGTKVYTSSFPSGHAMVSALAYSSFVYVIDRVSRNGRISRIVIGAAALIVLFVGISRVFLGVHWPTDILAGWVAGLTWFLLCCGILKIGRQEN
nr:phosphatase PAP2 family protein [Alteromonas sp. C1M14]